MRNRKGFTLIELLVVIAIIGFLASITVVAVKETMQGAYYVRTRHEINTLGTAMELYLQDNNYEYPCDVDRGLPPGIEKYLSTNPKWPEAPWPGSVYDWDYWHPDPSSTGSHTDPDSGKEFCAGNLADKDGPSGDGYSYSPDDPVYQVTIRFCEYEKPETCRFPDEPWAEDWPPGCLNCAVYWCVSGPCRSHGGEDYDYMGCCIGGACPEYAPRCE